MPTIRIIIRGKVQGVYFRASAKEIADGLGITGWVRNCADGSVEAIATGSDEAVKRFVEWCRKGPAGATVSSIETEPLSDEVFEDFRIRRS